MTSGDKVLVVLFIWSTIVLMLINGDPDILDGLIKMVNK
jgi:hypothetical protein